MLLSALRVDVSPYRWFSCASLAVMERRKVTFKLYPNAREAERLTSWIRLHCELYNAALEERIDAYRKAGKSISYYDQQNALPQTLRQARSGVSGVLSPRQSRAGARVPAL